MLIQESRHDDEASTCASLTRAAAVSKESALAVANRRETSLSAAGTAVVGASASSADASCGAAGTLPDATCDRSWITLKHG